MQVSTKHNRRPDGLLRVAVAWTLFLSALPDARRPAMMMRKRFAVDARTVVALLAAALCTLCSLAAAQTKWDMPTAYPPNNFHTENITQFVADVDKATNGKVKITVHSNASLFKANEIKR